MPILLKSRKFWNSIIVKVVSVALSVKVMMLLSIFCFALYLIGLFTSLLDAKVITSSDYTALISSVLTGWASVSGVVVGLRGVMSIMNAWGRARKPGSPETEEGILDV